MPDAIVRLIGWVALLIHGDPSVLDRWLWVRRHLQKGDHRTFDAGCGNGAFSIYAARSGNEVLAASYSEVKQEDLRRRAAILEVDGIELRTLDLRMLDEHRGDLGVFDQIICLETIEHVTADEELVTALATMLEAGGRLLLSTPFDGHRPLYLEERNPTPVEDGFHVRYGYSPRRLRQLAENAGLEVASEAFISGVVSQKLINVMRRLTRRIGFAGAWLLVLPLRTLVVFDVPLTRLLRYPYLSVALVGVKRG